jgi:hypothetical protein
MGRSNPDDVTLHDLDPSYQNKLVEWLSKSKSVVDIGVTPDGFKITIDPGGEFHDVSIETVLNAAMGSRARTKRIDPDFEARLYEFLYQHGAHLTFGAAKNEFDLMLTADGVSARGQATDEDFEIALVLAEEQFMAGLPAHVLPPEQRAALVQALVPAAQRQEEHEAYVHGMLPPGMAKYLAPGGYAPVTRALPAPAAPAPKPRKKPAAAAAAAAPAESENVAALRRAFGGGAAQEREEREDAQAAAREMLPPGMHGLVKNRRSGYEVVLATGWDFDFAGYPDNTRKSALLEAKRWLLKMYPDAEFYEYHGGSDVDVTTPELGTVATMRWRQSDADYEGNRRGGPSYANWVEDVSILLERGGYHFGEAQAEYWRHLYQAGFSASEAAHEFEQTWLAERGYAGNQRKLVANWDEAVQRHFGLSVGDVALFHGSQRVRIKSMRRVPGGVAADVVAIDRVPGVNLTEWTTAADNLQPVSGYEENARRPPPPPSSKPFDPSAPRESYTKPHHFAVNMAANASGEFSRYGTYRVYSVSPFSGERAPRGYVWGVMGYGQGEGAYEGASAQAEQMQRHPGPGVSRVRSLGTSVEWLQPERMHLETNAGDMAANAEGGKWHVPGSAWRIHVVGGDIDPTSFGSYREAAQYARSKYGGDDGWSVEWHSGAG